MRLDFQHDRTSTDPEFMACSSHRRGILVVDRSAKQIAGDRANAARRISERLSEYLELGTGQSLGVLTPGEAREGVVRFDGFGRTWRRGQLAHDAVRLDSLWGDDRGPADDCA